ncbi:GH12999 [Drosophila grimshawi]|uniref:glycerol-3-phosphate dehydrogenase n=1 Tax=Drosophila grimshawi TaxID=7222 RepID=B4JP62_DROGR|nr:GH12999 [Drosophila grimshawi]
MLERLCKDLKTISWRQQQLRSGISLIMRNGYSNWKISDEGTQRLPKREDQVSRMQQETFDVLVIGGGAVGCGCALEATTRGFKTALIEAGDFGNGASSKSSKLIEGTNSFMHSAIQNADIEQMFMLQQMLSERAKILSVAPHLSRVQPMLMPIYNPLRLPVYWLGLKVYDAMAGMANVRGSHFMSKEATLSEFPLLRRDGLVGSLVYYDVQVDDARMCLALAMTAAKHDATVANYVCVTDLLPRDCDKECRKIRVKDMITNDSLFIYSRVIINATGSDIDVLRHLDDYSVHPITVPRMETHITLPRYYGSSSYGLLLPQEALTLMPFERNTLVGSIIVNRSDEPAKPNAHEVQNLLQKTRGILATCVQLHQNHVLSAWTAAKPAIKKYSKGVPIYLPEISSNQMITLAGGNWYTYRIMAMNAIEMAIKFCQLEPHSDTSVTHDLLLDGADGYCCMLPLNLVQSYDLPMDVANHLADSYGTNTCEMLSQCNPCHRRRLHPNFPYIMAEVVYACQREYACHMVDVIARRLRIAFVNAKAAAAMLPHIQSVMATQLGWSPTETERELNAAQRFLEEQMGLGCIVQKEESGNHRRRITLNNKASQLGLTPPDGISDVTNLIEITRRISSQADGRSQTGVSSKPIAASLSSGSENTLMRPQISSPGSQTAMMSTTGSEPCRPNQDGMVTTPEGKQLTPQQTQIISFSPYVIAGTDPKG